MVLPELPGQGLSSADDPAAERGGVSGKAGVKWTKARILRNTGFFSRKGLAFSGGCDILPSVTQV